MRNLFQGVSVVLLFVSFANAQQREGDNPFADKPREGDRPVANPFGDKPVGTLRNPFQDLPGASREGDAAGFKPQTEREAQLYNLVKELRGEIEALRQEVKSLKGGDRDLPSSSVARGVPADWRKTKVGGVFRTYDANNDGYVSLEEWLKLTNGFASDARREIQTKRFFDAGAGVDERLSAEEFVYWFNNREGATDRSSIQGDRPRVSPEGDRPRVSPEGDRPRVSPEGDRPRVSPEGDRGPMNQLEVLFYQHDMNRDGVVSGKEFMTLRGRLPNQQAQQYWMNFFRRFDFDKNGVWSGPEFVKAAQASAREQVVGDKRREGDRPAESDRPTGSRDDDPAGTRDVKDKPAPREG